MFKLSRRDFLKTTAVGTAAIALAPLLGGCGPRTPSDDFETAAPQYFDQNTARLFQAGFRVDHQQLTIPGLPCSYRFLCLYDLHIIIPSDEVPEEHQDHVTGRYETVFVDPNGTRPYILWERLTELIPTLDVDAVILGGDMLDFFSCANMAQLREGCRQFPMPVLYVRADHDTTTYYTPGITPEVFRTEQQRFDSNAPVFTLDFDGLRLVGINDGTTPISDTGIAMLEQALDTDLPVILINHMPYDSLVDPSLNQASREVWNDRALLWGYENTNYEVTDNVRRMLDLIYAADSPVQAVYAGHLHFETPHHSMLTETISQHVFSPAYRGNVGYITVSS